MATKGSLGGDILHVHGNQTKDLQAQMERLQVGNPAETEEVRGLTLHQPDSLSSATIGYKSLSIKYIVGSVFLLARSRTTKCVLMVMFDAASILLSIYFAYSIGAYFLVK